MRGTGMPERLGEPGFMKERAEHSYRWATGQAIGFFLTTLKEQGKIIGATCEGCGQVSVPAQSYCESCGADTSGFTEVGPRGVIISWAGVPGPDRGPDRLSGTALLPAPFRYVLVRLAGADTELLHLAPADERIKIGAAVVPEFRPREERTGCITDIRWFVPSDGSDRGEA